MKTQEINFDTTKKYRNSVWEYFLLHGLSATIAKLQDISELKNKSSWTGSIGNDILNILKSWHSAGMPDYPILEDKVSSCYNKMSLWGDKIIKSQDYISHGEVTQKRWTVLFKY